MQYNKCFKGKLFTILNHSFTVHFFSGNYSHKKEITIQLTLQNVLQILFPLSEPEWEIKKGNFEKTFVTNI